VLDFAVLLLICSLRLLHPFPFSADPKFARSQLTRFFTRPYEQGIRQFSLSDVASNILLFVPFGFLWLGARKRQTLAVAVGLTVGLILEASQIALQSRTPSVTDVCCLAEPWAGAAIFNRYHLIQNSPSFRSG
jgi:glycopeptide antibiotics resistance protein